MPSEIENLKAEIRRTRKLNNTRRDMLSAMLKKIKALHTEYSKASKEELCSSICYEYRLRAETMALVIIYLEKVVNYYDGMQ